MRRFQDFLAGVMGGSILDAEYVGETVGAVGRRV